MTRTEWSGFYGPSYRLLLAEDYPHQVDDDLWNAICEPHNQNPSREGHWEFLAIGYLHLIDRGSYLSTIHQTRLSAIATRFNPRPRTVNWRLMAKIIDVRLSGRHLNMDDLKAIRLYPEQSGFLPDEPKDNSSQYHAYMLLLIMRFADRSDLLLRRLVLKAINWMEEIWRQYGDPSPLGRGRFQLFGYASMVTCGHMAKDWGVNVDPLWVNAARVRARPETPTGAMSATWAGPFRHCLLHGYNTTDDYAAFAELWLRGIPAPDSVESMTGHVVPRSTQLWWHPVDHDGSGLVATNSGPIIALLKNHQRPPAQRPGVISFFKQLLISPFQQKKLTLTPQLIHHDKPFAVDGFVISQQTDKLVIQNNESTLNQHLVLESTTVWGKNAADKFSFSGSCEVEELTWARQSSAAWYGVCFRMARHANAALEWTV